MDLHFDLSFGPAAGLGDGKASALLSRWSAASKKYASAKMTAWFSRVRIVGNHD
jgi:hypothetical protein